MALFKKQPGIGLGQDATPEWHLPEGSTASGRVNLEGSALIDGHFDGDITANDRVIIGESAVITGDVKAVSIIVAGTVKGDITGSERIEICPSAKVLGNLTAPQVAGTVRYWLAGTVRSDVTGSKGIEICPSAEALGNLTAPQVLGQGVQDPEFAVSPKRPRMRRVAVPSVAFAAIGATLLIAFLHDWRGNIADESAKVATLRAKSGPAHAARDLSPLSGAHFAHRETSRATVPESSSASSVAAPNASASSSDLMIKIPHSVPTPVAPDYTVRRARKDRSLAPGSVRSVFPSTKVEAITSAPGHSTHASPLPVEPKEPRVANAEALSPLAKQSTATAAGIADSQQQSHPGSAVAAPAVAKAQDGRMATNAGAEALGTADRPTNESPITIASVALRAAKAIRGIVSAPPAAQVMPSTPRPNDISGNSSEAATHISSLDIDSGPQGTENTIRAGTRITISNWKQYRAFMPDGMIALFSGEHGLKMPNDIEMDIGPPIHIVAPGSFRQATEKYSGETRVVHLPNGRNDIANYVAGEPFPAPQGPDKGYEILADLWYTYSPHLAVGMPGSGLWSVTMLDRFGNATKATWAFVYRQLAFNTDPGVPKTDPRSAGAFYTQWLMTEEPEQAKYTTDLDILPQNTQQNESNYIFLPALRRSMSLSVSSRCAPLLGTDWTHDDQKPGFNGGLANFDADYLRKMKMLALVNLNEAVSDFPREYDMPLGFARPSWGSWSLRDVWVINIHRIPSKAAGYCYAKRIEYIDEETARSLWTDLYDSNRNLWKVTMSAYHPRKVPGTDGETIYGRFAATTWDLQNQHATMGNSTDPSGRLIMFNAEVPREFDNVTEYSTPAGLMQIMR